MSVNGVRPLVAITGNDLVAEAESWRMPTTLVRRLVSDTTDLIVDNAAPLAHELAVVPGRALAIVLQRCQALRASM